MGCSSSSSSRHHNTHQNAISSSNFSSSVQQSRSSNPPSSAAAPASPVAAENFVDSSGTMWTTVAEDDGGSSLYFLSKDNEWMHYSSVSATGVPRHTETTATTTMAAEENVVIRVPALSNGSRCPLSNYYSLCALSFRGKDYPTVLHLYQAGKFGSSLPKVAESIRLSGSKLFSVVKMHEAQQQQQQQQQGRWNRNWKQFRKEWMRECLRMKFSQDTTAREALLGETGDAVLIFESKPGDRFFGNNGDDSGKNVLGELLMEVRAELRSNTLPLDRYVANGWPDVNAAP